MTESCMALRAMKCCIYTCHCHSHSSLLAGHLASVNTKFPHDLPVLDQINIFNWSLSSTQHYWSLIFLELFPSLGFYSTIPSYLSLSLTPAPHHPCYFRLFHFVSFADETLSSTQLVYLPPQNCHQILSILLPKYLLHSSTSFSYYLCHSIPICHYFSPGPL